LLCHVLVIVLNAILVDGLLPLLLVAEVRLVPCLASRLAVLVRHRTVALLLLRLLGSRHIIAIHLLLLELASHLMVARPIQAGCSLVVMSIGHLLLIHFRSAVVNFTAPWFGCTLVVITGRDIHICLRFDNVENLIISSFISRPLIIRIFSPSINSLSFQILHTSAILNAQATVVILQLAQQLLELLGVLSVDHVHSRVVTACMVSGESLHA
jgi:hypothetical protein